MYPSTLEEMKCLRYKKTVIALSATALVLQIIFFCTICVLLFQGAPFSFGILISISLQITPYVLLFLYVFSLYKKKKARVLIPLVFVFIPAIDIIDFIYYIFQTDMYYTSTYFAGSLISIVPSVIAAVVSFKGFFNKISVIIPILYSLETFLISAFNYYRSIKTYTGHGAWLEIMYLLVPGISFALLNVALLLLVTNKRSLVVFSPHSGLKSPSAGKSKRAMTPEQEFSFLKDKLDFGLITPKEFEEALRERNLPWAKDTTNLYTQTNQIINK